MKYQIDGFCPTTYVNCDPTYLFINAKTKIQQTLNADIIQFRDDPYDDHDAVMLQIAESHLRSINEATEMKHLEALFDIFPIEE